MATLPYTPHQMTDADTIRRFILAGNSTFTLRNSQTGRRYTLKVVLPKKDGKVQYGAPNFVKLMDGPDNETSYKYMGIIRHTKANGSVPAKDEYSHGGAKAKIPEDARAHTTFAWLWRTINGTNQAGKTLADFPTFEFWHEGRCGRCGRKLTVPESIANGMGPECAGK
jgi:hypothetical protein